MRKNIVYISILILAVTYSYAFSSNVYMENLRKSIKAINSGEYEKASEILTRLINEEPQYPEAYSAMAILNISKGNYETAREYIIQSLEKNGEYSQAYYLEGIVAEQLQDYKSALKGYTKFLEYEPEFDKKKKILKKIAFLKEKIGR